MKRQKVFRNYSKKVFKKTAGLRTKKNNTSSTATMRGGRRA